MGHEGETIDQKTAATVKQKDSLMNVCINCIIDM